MSSRSKLIAFTMIVILAVVSACASADDEGPPLNAQLTEAAWTALGEENFEVAVEKAARCINEFKVEADRQQAHLERTNAPLPPKGGGLPEAEREAIFSRGLLNDVAASYFITGEALEKLGRIDEARAAYEAATQYTYARIWDPRGWFWSPAEGAAKQLRKLAE